MVNDVIKVCHKMHQVFNFRIQQLYDKIRHDFNNDFIVCSSDCKVTVIARYSSMQL